MRIVVIGLVGQPRVVDADRKKRDGMDSIRLVIWSR